MPLLFVPELTPRSLPLSSRDPLLPAGQVSHAIDVLRPGNGRGRTARPREEWIPVQVLAIVDPELWELAHAQLARNRAQARRNNTKHAYLLRGLLICGRCGRRLIGMWT
jgi:hypothetical protein